MALVILIPSYIFSWAFIFALGLHSTLLGHIRGYFLLAQNGILSSD